MVKELRAFEEPGPADDVLPTPPEMLQELARLRRVDNPANLYQVCNLTLDSQQQARLFPLDGFPTLALAEAFVKERASEGRASGLVILAVAKRVAEKLGEVSDD